MDRVNHQLLIDAITSCADRDEGNQIIAPFQQWLDYLEFIDPETPPPTPPPDPEKIFDYLPALDRLRTVPPETLINTGLTHLYMAQPYLIALMMRPISEGDIEAIAKAYIVLRQAIEKLEQY
jgi:hypothetical protein